MQKIQSPFVLYLLGGIAGVVARDTYSLIANQVGLAKFQIWEVGARIFIQGPDVTSFLGNVVGFLNDLVVGPTLGVITGLFIEWRGPKYYILKGWGIGLLAWLGFFGIVFHNLPFMADAAPKDPLSAISAFIGHSIFGIVTAWVIVKLMRYSTYST